MGIINFDFGDKTIDEKVIVESGHIYYDEKPTDGNFVNAKIGKAITHILKKMGYEAEEWLFIDDYNHKFNGNSKKLDVEEYKRELNNAGNNYVKTIYESEFIKKAEESVDELIRKNLAHKNYNSNIVLSKKVAGSKMELYDPQKNHYKCGLLDACFYMMKMENAKHHVTILDKSFLKQHTLTLTILQKIGYNTENIYPVFFSLNGVKGKINSSMGGSPDNEPIAAILNSVKYATKSLQNLNIPMNGMEAMKYVI